MSLLVVRSLSNIVCGYVVCYSCPKYCTMRRFNNILLTWGLANIPRPQILGGQLRRKGTGRPMNIGPVTHRGCYIVRQLRVDLVTLIYFPKWVETTLTFHVTTFPFCINIMVIQYWVSTCCSQPNIGCLHNTTEVVEQVLLISKRPLVIQVKCI